MHTDEEDESDESDEKIIDEEFAEQEFQEYLPTLITIITTLIKTGFASEKQIMDLAHDSCLLDLDETNWTPRYEPVVKDAIAAHIESQQRWPEVTDCDRLDAAFEKLGRQGIIPRHNYWCCSTCGTTAIDAELNDRIMHWGQPTKGYVYYHEQDTEGAVDINSLCLRYGAADYSDAQTREVADTIIKALHDEGLKTEWNGDVNSSIVVFLDWKRRQQPKPVVPFLQRRYDPSERVQSEHYKEEVPDEVNAEAEAKQTRQISESDKAKIKEWVPVVFEHFQSQEPSAIKVEAEKLELMKKVFEHRATFAEKNGRPSSDVETAQAIGVHPLMINSIAQVLRFHLHQLSLATST